MCSYRGGEGEGAAEKKLFVLKKISTITDDP